MMKKFSVLLLLLLLTTGAFAEKVAVMSKVQGDVRLQKADAGRYGQTAVRGTILENNDKIRVGEGFAALLLLDDHSLFKLRENTEVRLTLVQDLSGADYHVRMDYGQALTKYAAETRSGFHVHTPTSVVSVKGTEFWVVSDPNAGDDVIVLEGEVSVVNNVTGTTSTATTGQTIRSSVDGTIQAAPTDEGSIPEDPDPDDSFGLIEPGTAPPTDPGLTEEKPSGLPARPSVLIGLVMTLGLVLILLHDQL